MDDEGDANSDEVPKLQGHLWTSNYPESLITIGRHTVAYLAFGSRHCLFLTDKAQAFSFGRNDFGQLGLGDTGDRLNEPHLISSLPTPVKAIACGLNFSAAITDNGEVYMWGDNSHGQCGNNTTEIHSPVQLPIHDFIGRCFKCGMPVAEKVYMEEISCGANHTLAVSSKHELWCWGSGPQLGLSSTLRSLPLKNELLKDKKVISVSCGESHSLALVENIANDDNEENYLCCTKCSSSKDDTVICPLGLPLTAEKTSTPKDIHSLPEGISTVFENESEIEDSGNIICDNSKNHADSNDQILVNESSVSSNSHAISCEETSLFTDNEPNVESISHLEENDCKPEAIIDSASSNSIAKSSSSISNINSKENFRKEDAGSDENQETYMITKDNNSRHGSEYIAVEAQECGSDILLDEAPENIQGNRKTSSVSIGDGSIPTAHVKRTTSMLNAEEAQQFLDRQMSGCIVKPKSRTVSVASEVLEAVQETFPRISQTASPMKNIINRVTEKFAFVSFGSRLSQISQDSSAGSAESFEIIESENFGKSSPNPFAVSDKLSRSKGSSESDFRINISLEEIKKNKEKFSIQTEVWSWGKGDNGQLGHGDDLDRLQPCLVKNLMSAEVIKICAGYGHSLVLTSRSKVLSWGLNDVFQLGHNPTSKCISTPKPVLMPRQELIWDIAVGKKHSLFLVDAGGFQSMMYACGQQISEKQKLILPVRVFKKSSLVFWLFGGGPYSGCLVDNMDSEENGIFYEFAATERKYLTQLHLIKLKVIFPLMKEGNVIPEIPQYIAEPLSELFESFAKLLDLIMLNVVDLRLVVQRRIFSGPLQMVENEKLYIQAYLAYIRSLSDVIAVGGFTYFSRMICFTPSTVSSISKEVFGDSSKSSSEALQQLLSLPVKKINEYARLFTRLVAYFNNDEDLFTQKLKSLTAHLVTLLEIASKETALAENTKKFWESTSTKLVDAFRTPKCRILRESKTQPLTLLSSGRFSSHHFILFNDKFVHSQFAGFQDHSLRTVWVESLTDTEAILNAFNVILPEDTLTFTCLTSSEKTEWVCAINQAIRKLLNSSGGDSPMHKSKVGYDSRLNPRTARHASYVFTKSVLYRDATYTGMWLLGQLHGHGELKWPDGRRYSGKFKNNLQHGEGEYAIPSADGSETVYKGTWKNGKMNGLGSARYPNGDLYEGYFKEGLKDGHGILKEGKFLSSAASIYVGRWSQNKRHGYGVLDNVKDGEKYMGMWQDDCCHGNGIVVTLDGVYYEGTFISDKLSGYGVMIFEDNTCFEGELGPGGMLNGRGILSLSNGDEIEGIFSGLWTEGIKINGTYKKFVSSDNSRKSELETSKLNRQNSQLSVQADRKWQDIFGHCKDMLRIQGIDSIQDNKQAWDAVAVAINAGKKRSHIKHRSKQSLEDSLDYLERIPQSGFKQKELTPEQYMEIQDYLHKAFDCIHHPLGYLLEGLVDVYRVSYLGVGAHPRLLVHAVEEVKSFTRRIYTIIRVLFPNLPPENKPLAFRSPEDDELDEEYDSDDDIIVDKECVTPATLLHPVLLPRLYPPLFTLYALNNETEDNSYWERLLKWNKQSDLALMTFLGVDQKFALLNMTDDVYTIERKRLSSIKDECFCVAIEALQHISTAFTPLDKLKRIRLTFEEITKEVQKCLGDFLWNMDDLFPVFQYVVVRARIRHLGSEIQLIDDLMEPHFQHGELGIMFTTLKACYFQIRNEKMHQV